MLVSMSMSVYLQNSPALCAPTVMKWTFSVFITHNIFYIYFTLKRLVVPWRTVCEVWWWRPQAHPWPLVRLVPVVPLLQDLWGRSVSQRPALHQPQVQVCSLCLPSPPLPEPGTVSSVLYTVLQQVGRAFVQHFWSNHLPWIWFKMLITSSPQQEVTNRRVIFRNWVFTKCICTRRGLFK
jgi:hypothetical protein